MRNASLTGLPKHCEGHLEGCSPILKARLVHARELRQIGFEQSLTCIHQRRIGIGEFPPLSAAFLLEPLLLVVLPIPLERLQALI